MSFDSEVKADKSILLRLASIEDSIKKAAVATNRAAERMKEESIKNLETQGRGGQGPELSDLTKRIYDQVGEPDGSGIRNHLEVSYKKLGSRQTAVLGLPQGNPSIVARVQNEGATIPVTDSMRGYLSAALGIHLKASTTHIVVPGRKFWDLAYKTASAQLKAELAEIFKEKK